MDNLKLSSPWISYARKVYALFGQDPEIKMVFDNVNYVLKMYVDNEEKAEAISQILPGEVQLGNVTLKIMVIPANKVKAIPENVFQKAFKGNPAFVGTQTIEGVFANPLTYVIFKNKVVQYFNDDLSDLNSFETTLYEDLATEIFGEVAGTSYCTERGSGDSEPLTPWP